MKKRRYPMTTRPKMADVAALAGVSAMTVSRAFKQPDTVSEIARERIRHAVETLGYVLDQTAGTLSSNRSGFVAVLLPSLDNSNFSDTARGLTEELERADLQVLLGYTDYDVDKEDCLIETMLRRRPEAMVVTGGHHTTRARHRLINAGIPIVEMWDTPTDPIHHVVGFSNAAATYAMVSCLAEQGYKEIGFIGGTSQRDARGADRRDGYEQAVHALDLPKGRVIAFGQPPISMAQGAEAIIRMIKRFPKVDAVVCVSDLSAFGAIMECQRQGWQVPNRIAIAGFGNFEVAACCNPRISTISLNCYKIGSLTGEIILRAIEKQRHGEDLPAETILIPYQVLQREST